MHGTEHRVSERRALRLLAPREPVCPATVRPTSGLHRRSTVRPRFPIDLRLSSAIYLSALPSNSTSDSHRLSDPSGWPFGRSPACAFDQPYRAQPSGQPSTCVSDQPSGSAFASTCDSRRLPILRPAFRPISSLRLRSVFRLNFPANLFDLRLLVNLPVPPSKPNLRISSAVASSGCLRTDPRLAPRTNPPACLRANLWLSPSINPPTVPSG